MTEIIKTKESGIWTTVTGKKIRVCDMSNGHLENTINMIGLEYVNAYKKLRREGYSSFMAVEMIVIPEIVKEMITERDKRQMSLGEPEVTMDHILGLRGIGS